MSAYAAMATLVRALHEQDASGATIVDWACPVPYFGRLSSARIATVGINPSNKEFVADDGAELLQERARLPTRRSLDLTSWGAADHEALRDILRACEEYFDVNPYGRWFGVLDRILIARDATYYGSGASACHIDVVPFATHAKWGEIPRATQADLLRMGLDSTALLLRDSPVQVLVLNDRSVANALNGRVDVLEAHRIPGWDLPRANGPAVPGLAYTGTTTRLGTCDLGRRVQILGWNHNLQSSFGVTGAVKDEIARWLADRIGPGE